MANVVVILAAQFFSAFGQVAMVILAGIIGAKLAPDPRLATLPVALAIVGVALATVPVVMAMGHFGRRRVLTGGMGLSACGAALAATGIQIDSFALFCAGSLLIGVNLAFAAQFRFAAAESVPPELASQAIAWVMLGVVGAALVAPLIALSLRDAIGQEYVGSFAVLSLSYLAAAAMIMRLRDPQLAPTNGHAGRPLGAIVTQPVFLLALFTAATGFGVMSLIMTATPLSMHVLDGHDLQVTTGVLQAHILAMYLPSLCSGWLVARLGVGRMICVGAGLEAFSCLAALSGNSVGHYGFAMIALGVGWNFLYVAGTTLLTRSYAPAERFKAQAVNDQCLFAIMAIASLLAGWLLTALGWHLLVSVALIPLAVLLLALGTGLKQGLASAGSG